MKRLLFLVALMVTLAGCTLFGDRTIPVEYSTEIMLDDGVLGDWEMRIPLCQPQPDGILPRTIGPQVMVIKNGVISTEEYPDEQKLIELYPNADEQNGDYDTWRKVEAIVAESENDIVQHLRDNYYVRSASGFPEEQDGFLFAVFYEGLPSYTAHVITPPDALRLFILVIDMETEQPVYVQMIQIDNHDLITGDYPVLVEP